MSFARQLPVDQLHVFQGASTRARLDPGVILVDRVQLRAFRRIARPEITMREREASCGRN